MTAAEVISLSAADLAAKLRAKEVTARAVAEAYLAVIDKKNAGLNAYLGIYDDVLAQADEADKKLTAGEPGSLLGIPIALKDNLLWEGREVTAASKILEGYKATYTATAVQKLLDAGAVLIGRTNMDEFAMGGSTENSAFGVTKNPRDTSRVSGGSSGGSAVAVAAHLAAGALGSDTGGSVRQPASFCGVVGFKPTYGAVSRYGLIAMASSFDVVGTFGRTVADAKLLFEAIRGRDEMDMTTDEQPLAASKKKVVGVPRALLAEGVDADVLTNFEASIEKLRAAGYEVRDVELPSLSAALAVYYILVPAEVSSNMARYDGVRFGKRLEGKNLFETYRKTRGAFLGEEVKRRILVGTYALSAGYADEYYRTAVKARRAISAELDRAFKDVDLIATPTSPFPAWKVGEKAGDVLATYLADVLTVGANVAGAPAISVPAGEVTRDGVALPTGLQLIAPRWGEERLFAAGQAFERMGA